MRAILTLIACLSLLAGLARANPGRISASATLDYFSPPATIDLGDVGGQIARDVSRWSPGLRLLYSFTDTLGLEFAYRYTPEMTVRKVSPNLNIFPVPVVFPAVTTYEIAQRSRALSVGPSFALPITPKLKLNGSVFGTYENTSIDLAYIDWVSRDGIEPPRETASPVPFDDPESFRFGARFGLDYALSQAAALTISVTVMDSELGNAKYLGGGFTWNF